MRYEEPDKIMLEWSNEHSAVPDIICTEAAPVFF
jgi:hypothetical protein